MALAGTAFLLTMGYSYWGGGGFDPMIFETCAHRTCVDLTENLEILSSLPQEAKEEEQVQLLSKIELASLRYGDAINL